MEDLLDTACPHHDEPRRVEPEGCQPCPMERARLGIGPVVAYPEKGPVFRHPEGKAEGEAGRRGSIAGGGSSEHLMQGAPGDAAMEGGVEPGRTKRKNPCCRRPGRR